MARDQLVEFLGDYLNATALEQAATRAGKLGVDVQSVLFADQVISPHDYTNALARKLNVRIASLPEHASGDAVLIDAVSQAPSDVAANVFAAQQIGREPLLFVGAGHRSVDANERLAKATVRHAVEDLRIRQPVASAGRRMWLWQYLVSALLVGSVGGAVTMAPAASGMVALCASALIFSAVAAFRLLVLIAAVEGNGRNYAKARRLLDDGELPTYTVLVPLFREAAILSDLIGALSNLDYPPAKLDVVLILEESDDETIGVARLARLPAHMRMIVVPDREPRTKPKALNMALALTRGDYVAVFDAEDIPAADQLRKAASVFASRPERYACLQARLAIYNPRQSWYSRHFALEYAALFHAFLPAIVLLRLPIPLSGTSNHFPRAVLEETAWDPFNVTEDADLGVRLMRHGGKIGLIDSETHEEAPATFRQWLPQRTRWIKGWMQTYLVHTRQPLRLWRDLGSWRVLGLHALFGGFLISALSYPVFFVLLAFELGRPAPFATTPGSLHHLALVVALMAFITGVASALALAVLGSWRAGLGRLSWHILAAPLYWLLISLAFYRALNQIVWRPHLWEKTSHAARHGRPLQRTGASRRSGLGT